VRENTKKEENRGGGEPRAKRDLAKTSIREKKQIRKIRVRLGPDLVVSLETTHSLRTDCGWRKTPYAGQES